MAPDHTTTHPLLRLDVAARHRRRHRRRPPDLIPLTVDEIRRLINVLLIRLIHTGAAVCVGHTGEDYSRPEPDDPPQPTTQPRKSSHDREWRLS
jgi:hypothetical protein